MTTPRDVSKELPVVPPLTPSQLADPALTDPLPPIVRETGSNLEDESIESIASILLDFSREISRSSTFLEQVERSALKTPTTPARSLSTELLSLELSSASSCSTPSSGAFETQSSESSSSSLSGSSSGTPSSKVNGPKSRIARKRLFKRKVQRPKKKKVTD
eukprot:TRINITY_DN2785_c0_g1_i2.p1 TRINITY_DN2785_c0_g1~~TRINITY_DN2785_c0_g1_i2.p1  ORF type:complete len:161 (+),score=3.84 TRINITY_DN2785_c0_g1_i2:120-602(+)